MSEPALNDLTAAHVMREDVVAVEKQAAVQDAVRLMGENRVTGVPVVDSRRRCVGVISSTDILKLQQEDPELKAARYYDPDTLSWESIPAKLPTLQEMPDVTVGDIMSPEVISVRPETPIKDVAQTMVDRNVHCVLVLDENEHLCGIISAFDFVRILSD